MTIKREKNDKKTTKQKRNLTTTSYVSDADTGNVKRMLAIGK